jgi:hypothetical protein
MIRRITQIALTIRRISKKYAWNGSEIEFVFKKGP